jgi:hypothetical protein
MGEMKQIRLETNFQLLGEALPRHIMECGQEQEMQAEKSWKLKSISLLESKKAGWVYNV